MWKMLKSPCDRNSSTVYIQHSYILCTYIQGKAETMTIISDLTPVLTLNNKYSDVFIF